MNIILDVDIKTLRKAYAIVGEEIPNDEDLKKKFENIVINFSENKMADADMQQVELGICLLAIGIVDDEQNKK